MNDAHDNAATDREILERFTTAVSYCAIHDSDEEITEGSITCFECGHVYPDVADIIAAAKDEGMFDRNHQVDPQEITFCPICLHDW